MLTAEREEADYKKLSQKMEKDRVRRETAERIERKTIAELTSRGYTDEDRRMVNDAIEHVMTAKPVVATMPEAISVARAIRAKTPKGIVANMIDYFEKSYPKGIDVPDIGNVEVNRDSAKSIMAHANTGLTISKYAVIAKLGDVLKSAKVFSLSKNWKGRPYDSVNLVSPFQMGNESKFVEVTVIKHHSGESELYNIKVIPKEIVEERTHLVAAPKSDREQNDSSTTANMIPNSVQPVNRGGRENLAPPKLPSSNLVRQYLAANGLLTQYLPKTPAETQDAAPPFDLQDFKAYLEGTL